VTVAEDLAGAGEGPAGGAGGAERLLGLHHARIR
jgi:hypothetical protein